MKKHFPIYVLTALAAALVVSAVAMAAPAKVHATHAKAVTIVMKDPGCHWFSADGKIWSSLSVQANTTFRNLDEAAVVFKSANFTKRVAVGKTLKLAKAGTYRITMVGQASDDNHLLLVVK